MGGCTGAKPCCYLEVLDMSHVGVVLAEIALDEFDGCERRMFELMGMENRCRCPSCET